MIPTIRYSEKSKTREAVKKQVVSRGWGEERAEETPQRVSRSESILCDTGRMETSLYVCQTPQIVQQQE